MKWTLIIVGGLVALGAILMIIRGEEDTWIKDSRSVWVKHGNPSKTPSQVIEQQELIQKVLNLYQKAKEQGTDFTNGPCLGTIDSDWVADIAHSPRQDGDDLPENQCPDFREGKANHFIELDPKGEIIKVR
ncbi:MAG: Uncharacterized protein CEN89_524 [Candidatus Berkelbacteria bacterium Licking1014_7]|uniref:Uncharacterized protein n=1 Tax=Candidatus Berkelbacteria bacterium Licking1014_7 TaxID=2017147 RepID=A0A554LIM0_9BACT|nr:MAG: Uncharacterized protein CEN89_524 [Candidatus Berkelbacteria bacterium Licking1014_7]